MQDASGHPGRGLRLLGCPRFRGLFWTQLLGALNDNVYRNALILMVVYQGLRVGDLEPVQISLLAQALFILPFFLFSATSGQLADKLEKARWIQGIKLAELALAGFAAVALLWGHGPMMLAVLFGLGLQSTLFGPVKYSALPQLLEPREQVGGNALVEGGTNLAILLGTLVAGVLIGVQGPWEVGGLEVPVRGTWLVSAGVLLLAWLGWLASRQVPPCPPPCPHLRVSWNPIPPTWEILRLTFQERGVGLAVLGISWFWLYGGAVLALLPYYGRDTLGVTEGAVTLMLALFSIGVVVGSILCERFSHERLELGLVPFGSLGMSLFALHLGWLGAPPPRAEGAALRGPWELASSLAGGGILLDLGLLALFSGFFIVPLYTMLGQWTDPAVRSRIIAGNNVVNALFMVLSYGLIALLLGPCGLSLPQIFVVLALLNGAVALYIYTLLPEFLLRFLAYLLAHGVYHLRVRGSAHIPAEGPALLVCNHVSFVDWLILSAGVARPMRFVMWHGFAEMPLFRFLFKHARVIPIGSRTERPELVEEAFAGVARELRAGQLVCLFPEGRITADGQLERFRPGVERMLAETPVPVVPMALRGLWGSLYSRKPGRLLERPGRSWRSPVELVIGPPQGPEGVTAASLQQTVEALRGDRL